MESTLKRNIRNSEIVVAKEKRSFLTYPAVGLVPCTLEETEDSVNFLFDTQGLEPSEEVLNKPKWEKLRFLVDCADLENLNLEYDFSLSLDNLMIDINLMPKVLIRDAKKPGNQDFLKCYKALIGNILLRKYKYDDYLNGGQDLYKKNKLLAELNTLETVEEIKNRLLTEYRNAIHEVSKTRTLVSKKNVWISRITIPVLGVTLAAVLFLGGRMMLIDMPFRDSIITASIAYINRDVLAVQRALRNYDISVLSDETKHFLSRSYVSTEALTHTQIDNILVGLTRMTDPIIFDYWILLGRLQFDEAIDIAQRLGDDELLLFAYLKYQVYIRNDLSIPGEERVALLSELERNIDNLNRARDEAAQSALMPVADENGYDNEDDYSDDLDTDYDDGYGYGYELDDGYGSDYEVGNGYTYDSDDDSGYNPDNDDNHDSDN